MSGVEERKGFLLLLFVGALLFPYRVEYDWGFFSTLSVLDVLLVILLPVVLLRALVWKGGASRPSGIFRTVDACCFCSGFNSLDG